MQSRFAEGVSRESHAQLAKAINTERGLVHTTSTTCSKKMRFASPGHDTDEYQRNIRFAASSYAVIKSPRS